MREFPATLRLPGERGPGLSVTVFLDGDTIAIRTGSVDLGTWTRRDVILYAEDDGIHLRAEGEEVILHTDDDALFAVELGLRHGPPTLRRRMAELWRRRDHDALVVHPTVR